jgi:hypothetical protein
MLKFNFTLFLIFKKIKKFIFFSAILEPLFFNEAFKGFYNFYFI